MKVREILDAKGRGVVTIRSDATVSTAVRRLALEHVGALVVSDDGARIAGILSERDIVAGLARDGADLLATGRRVADLMTRNVATCGPDDTVKHLMAEMTRRRVRHLPVVAVPLNVGMDVAGLAAELVAMREQLEAGVAARNAVIEEMRAELARLRARPGRARAGRGAARARRGG